MNERVTRIGVADEVAAVENRSGLAVGAANGDLELTYGPVGLEQADLLLASLRVGVKGDRAAVSQLRHRRDAGDLEERVVGVKHLAVARGDVDAFPNVPGELAQALGIAQAAKARGPQRRGRS